MSKLSPIPSARAAPCNGTSLRNQVSRKANAAITAAERNTGCSAPVNTSRYTLRIAGGSAAIAAERLRQADLLQTAFAWPVHSPASRQRFRQQIGKPTRRDSWMKIV